MIARSVARPAQRGLPNRHRRRRRVVQHLLDPRIAVERDVLVVEDRIGIRDRARHERPRIGRRGRHDDLQPRRPVEPGFGVLAVVRTGMPQPAPRHAQDHRHAPPHRYRIFAALLTSWLNPVATKSLNCISPIGRWPASAAPTHTPITAPSASGEFKIRSPNSCEQRPQQQKRIAVFAADVLPEDEHAGIGAQARPPRRA